jgi:hypothetical protein
VKELKQAIDRGTTVIMIGSNKMNLVSNLTGEDVKLHEQDVNDVSGVLKMFFRDLSEPLLTYNLYDDWIAAAGIWLLIFPPLLTDC